MNIKYPIKTRNDWSLLWLNYTGGMYQLAGFIEAPLLRNCLSIPSSFIQSNQLFIHSFIFVAVIIWRLEVLVCFCLFLNCRLHWRSDKFWWTSWRFKWFFDLLFYCSIFTAAEFQSFIRALAASELVRFIGNILQIEDEKPVDHGCQFWIIFFVLLSFHCCYSSGKIWDELVLKEEGFRCRWEAAPVPAADASSAGNAGPCPRCPFLSFFPLSFFLSFFLSFCVTDWLAAWSPARSIPSPPHWMLDILNPLIDSSPVIPARLVFQFRHPSHLK